MLQERTFDVNGWIEEEVKGLKKLYDVIPYNS
jgi:hypothetical protein